MQACKAHESTLAVSGSASTSCPGAGRRSPTGASEEYEYPPGGSSNEEEEDDLLRECSCPVPLHGCQLALGGEACRSADARQSERALTTRQASRMELATAEEASGRLCAAAGRLHHPTAP